MSILWYREQGLLNAGIVFGPQLPGPEGNGAEGDVKEEGQVSPWLFMGRTLVAEQGSV